jgi:hypothetical protein
MKRPAEERIEAATRMKRKAALLALAALAAAVVAFGVRGWSAAVSDVLLAACAGCALWCAGLVYSNRMSGLERRVRALEEMSGGPRDFRHRIRDLAPMPLQRVYEFSFWTTDQFWRDTLKATREEIEYANENGTRLHSVRIEEWRSHSIAKVVETPLKGPVSYDSTRRIYLHPTRSIDLYPTADWHWEGVTLWEQPLGPAEREHMGWFPRLELRLQGGRLQLSAIEGRFGRSPRLNTREPRDENVFFDVPLEGSKLRAFKSPDREANFQCADPGYQATLELADYAHEDPLRGLGWALRIHDFQKWQEQSDKPEDDRETADDDDS